MRAIVQRVKNASVTVEGKVVGQIGRGFMVLVGMKADDTQADVDYISNKIVNLRVFEDEAGKMNRSLLENGGGALIVSQFTLYGDVRGGRRPSFIEAACGERANELYEAVCKKVAESGIHVERGIFGAMMDVALINDGPVTLLLDSRKGF
jgi:D-tyrosyl-tRNA(Tyr) deacylase